MCEGTGLTRTVHTLNNYQKLKNCPSRPAGKEGGRMHCLPCSECLVGSQGVQYDP